MENVGVLKAITKYDIRELYRRILENANENGTVTISVDTDTGKATVKKEHRVIFITYTFSRHAKKKDRNVQREG